MQVNVAGASMQQMHAVRNTIHECSLIGNRFFKLHLYLNSTTVSLNVDNITNFDFFFLKCFINGWIQLKNVRNRKPYLAVWDVYCLPINGLTAISLKPLKGRATTFISVLFWVTPDNFTQQSGTLLYPCIGYYCQDTAIVCLNSK